MGLTFPFNVTTMVAMFCLVAFKNAPEDGAAGSVVANDPIDWALVTRQTYFMLIRTNTTFVYRSFKGV